MRRDTRLNASGKCPKIKADTAAEQSSYLKPTLNLELNQYVGYNTTEQYVFINYILYYTSVTINLRCYCSFANVIVAKVLSDACC